MTNLDDGHFVVGQLPDGRFLAASTSAPFFCFRDESEQAVVAKVVRALTFYGNLDNRALKNLQRSVTQTITTLRPTRRVSFDEASHLVAA